MGNYSDGNCGTTVRFAAEIILLIFAIPVLQGCTTGSAAKLDAGLVSAVNSPGGTVGCIAPNIVTRDGKCQAPKRLSWK